MAEYSFKLPDLGEGTVESEIVAWRAGVGDAVEADQPLVDVMTDKATIEITAPVSGTLVSVAGEPGQVIAVGAELAVFATEKGTEFNSVPGESEPAPARPQTSPAIRRLARERGIDLSRVRGTGTNGRITRADMEKIDKGTGSNSVPGESGACTDQAGKPAVAETGPDETGVHEIKLVGLRRKIAEQVSLSASRIPHFSYVEEVDVTGLEQLRQHLNETRQESQPKLTCLPFVMQALVKVAREFPRCNAHFDGERQVIRQFDPVHTGIAVQTADGLMVPVIRNVETLDLWQCAGELRDIAQRAREGRARREELSGSTITISSLGALGGIVSMPIINHPEVAIIGINRAQRRPVFEDNGVTDRLMMNISSSFDHRVVDGYDAACAIRALKQYLEFPATLFLPVEE